MTWLLFFALTLIGLSFAEELPQATTLHWHTEMQSAFDQAKVEHKNVIIMIGEKHCRWCVKMKNKTLTDLRVEQKLEKYVLLSLKRSNKEAVRKVEGFDGVIPSFFFTTDEGKSLASIVGYYKVDDFLQYINEIEEE